MRNNGSDALTTGAPAAGDPAGHADRAARWAPPCPLGNPQRVRGCLAYREREPGRLQLRVALDRNEGVCEAIVEESDDVVRVRVLVCYDAVAEARCEDPPEYCNCPVHVFLDRPLGDRTVVDVDTGPLKVYVPTW